MTALTADRNTPARSGNVTGHPIGAGATIYAGALACLNAAGWLVPGATATTLIAAGRAKARYANPGANGDVIGEVERGVFRFENSAAADLIARTEIGKDCYIVDDQTVAKTHGTNTRSIAGKVVDVDAQGVWVRVGY